MTSTQSCGAIAGWPASGGLQPLVKNWWMMARRGVLAALFGAAIERWRIPVFHAVIVSFGTCAIVDGILAIASALVAARPRMASGPIALEGVSSVVLGILAFVWPFPPRGVIGVLVVWGVLTGICEIVAGARLPRDLAAHWLVATASAFSIFLAVVALALPHAGSDRVALALSAYAIVFGIVVLVVSLGFRRVQ